MNKTVGIWGLGIVGQSAIRFFARRQWQIQVMDAHLPNPQQQRLLDDHGVAFVLQSPETISDFFVTNAHILASPGIDLRPYHTYKHKCITEADLFGKACNMPIIAITGSVGKTTVTTLLNSLLQTHGHKPFMGGNVGVGMLDMIDQQEEYDSAVIEVSSFQLEQSRSFAPDLAIITNIYPNHLDRHETLEQYTQSKINILAHQITGQHALIPWNLRAAIPDTDAFKNYFSTHLIPEDELDALTDRQALYYLTESYVNIYRDKTHTALFKRAALPAMSFDENWLIICAALTIMRIPLSVINHAHSITIPEHRLELVATINNVTFYNDSKSTVADSTLAAINQLKENNIILLLGGVSKGVSRESLIQSLPARVTQVYCFGKEATQLQQWCMQYNKPAHSFSTLDELFDTLQKKLAPGQCVLFSPAGTSYDLFTDYQHRGTVFKTMVTRCMQ